MNPMNPFASSWLEISKNAFEQNVSQYKKIIGQHNMLAPVIKSNAYGHGMLEIATLCQNNQDVDWLCVATLEEALLLNNHGISKPILILSTINADPVQAINKNICFTLYDWQTALQLHTIAKTHNTQFKVHIKIDTGLSRLGLQPHNIEPFLDALLDLPGIHIEGIFSHCAESQKEDNAFTLHQIKQFNEVVTLCATKKIPLLYKHIANSAATTAYDLNTCNFFRVGAGIYGLWPSYHNKMVTQQRHNSFNLSPILTWKARIIHIKEKNAQEFIGYDRTAHTTHPMRIAVIPIGYYDGYDRRFSNQGYVMIDNHYAPIIGRVSMNLTTIDITHLPQVSLGHVVTILANKPHITCYNLAERMHTENTRETLTRISAHLPRIIID